MSDWCFAGCKGDDEASIHEAVREGDDRVSRIFCGVLGCCGIGQGLVRRVLCG